MYRSRFFYFFSEMRAARHMYRILASVPAKIKIEKSDTVWSVTFPMDHRCVPSSPKATLQQKLLAFPTRLYNYIFIFDDVILAYSMAFLYRFMHDVLRDAFRTSSRTMTIAFAAKKPRPEPRRSLRQDVDCLDAVNTDENSCCQLTRASIEPECSRTANPWCCVDKSARGMRAREPANCWCLFGETVAKYADAFP
jgi:hypothetical protein